MVDYGKRSETFFPFLFFSFPTFRNVCAEYTLEEKKKKRLFTSQLAWTHEHGGVRADQKRDMRTGSDVPVAITIASLSSL